MTAARGTPEHKSLLAAAGSVLRRVQIRAIQIDPTTSTSELESALCIKPRSETSRPGATFEKYRDGQWEGVYGTLIQIIHAALSNNWLTPGDLRELGLEDVPKTSSAVAEMRKNRKKAAARFVTGQQREIEGLLPVAMRGPKGRLPRKPYNATEAAREHASFVAGIEELGGQITRIEWAPDWASKLASECNQQFVATYPDPPEIDDSDPRVKAVLDEGPSPEVLWMMGNDWPPAHHPWSVMQSKLWFGGREYSPYMHAITEQGYVWPGYTGKSEPPPSLPPLPPEASQN